MKNKTVTCHKFTDNQGVVLFPIIILILISLLIILTGSRELHQTFLMHQLKLHQDCIFVAKQIKQDDEPDFSHCPPCPEAAGCL